MLTFVEPFEIFKEQLAKKTFTNKNKFNFLLTSFISFDILNEQREKKLQNNETNMLNTKLKKIKKN